eukprot:Plantae.Rhodophyta-Hildenbrandia_rubra.ctg2499.p1 GENE.Plantae.Rhodophyta-Hildenbrandia_rubra.ctg2499~~Plantae.Rhodophyta-Hildenbrandia_rubra.ctg2499.p1  ORF type:complete len:334 (-),score=66.51 Plantae.Rhodophyta-Hildenbrandia_rubra.ctg2499:1140-2141(-)
MNQMANPAGQYATNVPAPRGPPPPPPNHAMTGVEVSPVGTRFSALVEQLKAEYEGITSEKGTHVRTIQEGYERQVQEQLKELSAMETALYTLNRKHMEMKESYEAEIARLRSQLPRPQQVVTHPGGVAGTAVATSPLGAGQNVGGQGDVTMQNVDGHQQQQGRGMLHAGQLSRPGLSVKMQAQPVVVGRGGGVGGVDSGGQQQQQRAQHADPQQGSLPSQYPPGQMYTMAPPQHMPSSGVGAPQSGMATGGPPSAPGMAYRMDAPPPGRMYTTVGVGGPGAGAPVPQAHEAQDGGGMATLAAAGMAAGPDVQARGMPPGQAPPPRGPVGGGAQ